MSAERASATLDLPAQLRGGVGCAECVSRLSARVESLPGVLRVDSSGPSSLRVEFDPRELDESELAEATQRFGVELAGVYAHAVWRVTGLDCPDCARTAEVSASMVPGVVSADLNFASGTLVVEYEPDLDPRARVEAAVARTGHHLEPISGARQGRRAAASWWSLNRTIVAALGSGVAGAVGFAAEWASLPAAIAWVAFGLSVAFGWLVLAPRAFASVSARRLDMNVLMMIASAGAFASGAPAEASAVVFLYTLGGWLEARALERTRGSIRELMSLAPEQARVVRDGTETLVAPADVYVGETVVVRPGERVSLDGVISSGGSLLDESAITGEPVAAAKQVGDPVFAGSLNGGGLLEVTVTAPAEDSAIARVVRLVEEAQAAKAPVELTVDRFSRYYTPAVVGLAAVLWVYDSIALGGLASAGAWLAGSQRALVVLVTACPCALVVSTPVAIVSAIARAGRDGVLVKGGVYLEVAARLRALAFDKTGTLTEGRPELQDVHPIEGDARGLLGKAASLEAHSNHPLASAVLEGAAERGIAPEQVTELEELPGRGVAAVLGGRRVMVASPAFADDVAEVPDALAVAIAECEDKGRSVLVVVVDGAAIGFLAVADPLRPEAAEIVSALERAGIEHTALLTGDNERTAAAVAAHAGVSAHQARMLPADKVDAVVRLRERYGTVAMVGDGVNDAPALVAADVGIAMGAAGSATALEAADVALMADDLSALPGFLALAKRTLSTVRTNVVVSVAVKAAVLVAALLGYATMWMAVFADTGVALIVIAWGMRLLVKRPVRSAG
jgi:Zn2+/Cd2+-exporting ATPase